MRLLRRHATTVIRPSFARLRGARLVTSVETKEGRRWAEAGSSNSLVVIKSRRTLCDRIFSSSLPQFKLIIVGNHKPGLRSVDEAIRRRFNLIPFTVTVPPTERDPDLAEKLKAEWPGILALGRSKVAWSGSVTVWHRRPR